MRIMGGEVGAEPRSPDKQRITAGFASLALLWVALHCQRAERAARGVSQKKKCLTLGHSHKERSEPNSIKDREISN